MTRCLVYAAYSFNGTGPAQSCASIVAHFPPELSTEVYLARARTPLPANVRVHESLPPLVRRLPWRIVARHADRAVDRAFLRALRRNAPDDTVVYVWPGSPQRIIEAAHRRGFPVVREMINSACATSGPILDEAYRSLDMAPSHGVSAEVIRGETSELLTYDYLFASNPEVEKSLIALGISSRKIRPTAFGWDPDRFTDSTPATPLAHGVRALFVGTIGVRKGIPGLLRAWQEADIDGELVLAGRVEPDVAELVDSYLRHGRVRLTGYVSDIGSLYRSADFFVFPTFEEGGPQVTYEAAGCGLPVITTPMGAARLVESERSGLVVAAGEHDQLRQALLSMAGNAEQRRRWGAEARRRAAEFTYQRVGRQRGEQLAEIAGQWRSDRRSQDPNENRMQP